MAERQQKEVVYGYIRQIHDESCPVEIIEIIYRYYLIMIDSKILTTTEQSLLYNLLYNALQKNNKSDKRIINVKLDLLYRASQNEFKAGIFHMECDERGPTITVIHNNYNHIFGGYVNKSWNANNYPTDDPDSFLFCINPTVKLYELKDDYDQEQEIDYNAFATWNFGPIFGMDVVIFDGQKGMSSIPPQSYNYTNKEMVGVDDALFQGCESVSWTVWDYEVFAVTITDNIPHNSL